MALKCSGDDLSVFSLTYSGLPVIDVLQDLGFSASDRGESVRRVGELACLFNDAGTITIVSLVSPYREDRDLARRRHEEQGLRFMEVFMDVPLDVVQDRDPKGLYKKVSWGAGAHDRKPENNSDVKVARRRGSVREKSTQWSDGDHIHACTDAQVAAGEIKGFTGIDAPYEPPLHPEITLPNYKMSIQE